METNQTTLPLICAVIDCQGFMIGRDFYVRELAVATQHHQVSIEVNTRINLTEQPNTVQRALRYQTQNIHGLPISSRLGRGVHESKIHTIIRSWLVLLKTNDRTFLACKNHQMGNILSKIGLTYVDLSRGSIKVPPYAELDKSSEPWICSKHTHLTTTNELNPHTIRCAERKAGLFWKWIDREVETTKLCLALETKGVIKD